MSKLIIPTIALGSVLVACGSSNDESDTTADDEAFVPDNEYDQEYAKCDLETYWSGDELCVVPPAEGEGFQLHYGPKDYTDPDEYSWYVVQPGDETNDSVPVTSPNTTEIFFSEYHSRLRPGTHHMILFVGGEGEGGSPTDPTGGSTSGDPLEDPANAGAAIEAASSGAFGRFLVGAQAALGDEGGRLDVPIPGETSAPENEGFAFRLEAEASISFNLHYVNAGDEPLLREGWVNFHYQDPDTVTEVMDPITFYGGFGMAVQPQTSETVVGDCGIHESGPDELRILGLSGHMHAHGESFRAYKVTNFGEANEERELIYETFDWAEPENLSFDSAHRNSPSDAARGLGGGHDGQLLLKKGERIVYECDFVNDDLDFPLRFANLAYEAEMCNLFGFYSPSLGGPWGCASTWGDMKDMATELMGSPTIHFEDLANLDPEQIRAAAEQLSQDSGTGTGPAAP